MGADQELDKGTWLQRPEGQPNRRVLAKPIRGLPELQYFGVDTFRKVSTLAEHQHQGCFEICTLVRGRATWVVGDERFEIRGGDMFVTWPDEVHGGLHGLMHPCALFWAVIKIPKPGPRSPSKVKKGPTFLSLPPVEADHWCQSMYGLPARVFPAARKVAPLMRRLERLLDPQLPSHISAIRATLQLFIFEVVSAAQEFDRRNRLASAGTEGSRWDPRRPGVGSTDAESARGKDAANEVPVEPPGIRRVREFLNSCPIPWPKIPELADLAGMSTSHFHACFAKEIGMAPLAYAHHVRLERASMLLGKKNASVTRAAIQLGYCSGQHLAGVFKRYLGLTPTQAAKEVVGRFGK